MSKSTDRLIEKMRKLLALTESGNEHEAMNATRKLHSMLAKHNMSMTDLEHEEDNVGQEEVVQKRCRPWRRTIALGIAQLYFCQYYRIPMGSNSKFVFVGTEANRTFAAHIYKMVIKTVERESRFESKKMYGKEVPAFVNGFWTGAMERIWLRCQELINSAKAGTLEDEDGNTLPALINAYELAKVEADNWIAENVGNLKSKTNKTRANDAAGYSKGTEAGNKVQLSRVIQGQRSPKLLGR